MSQPPDARAAVVAEIRAYAGRPGTSNYSVRSLFALCYERGWFRDTGLTREELDEALDEVVPQP